MNRRTRKSTPTVRGGSAEARKHAAIVLEVLSGLRTIADASTAMGLSQNRYYQLERRALDGLIAALEPRKRGRVMRSEDEISRLTTAKEKLEREVGRLQSLLRVAQRTIGIAAPVKDDGSKLRRGKKRRRSSARGKRVVLALRRGTEASASAPEPASSSVTSPELQEAAP